METPTFQKYSTFWEYAWAKSKLPFIAETVSVLVISAALIFIVSTHHSTSSDTIIYIVLGGLFLVLSLIIIMLFQGYILRESFTQVILSQFSDQNRYITADASTLDRGDGSIFQTAGSPSYTNLIRGTIGETLFDFFVFGVTIWNGRTRSTVHETVLKLSFTGSLPRLLITNYGIDGFQPSILKAFGFNTTTPLDPTINGHFNLYARPGEEKEDLELFTPDVFSSVMPDAKRIMIETTNHNAYIYFKGMIRTPSDLAMIFALARALEPKLTAIASKQIDRSSVAQAANALPKISANQLRARAKNAFIFIVFFIVFISAIVEFFLLLPH